MFVSILLLVGFYSLLFMISKIKPFDVNRTFLTVLASGFALFFIVAIATFIFAMVGL